MRLNIVVLSLLLAMSSVSAKGFSLSSPEIVGQLTLNEEFEGFGCKGANVSPKLSWVNAPEGTKSFAVTVYDPDAPTGSGWWHWIVYNIPKSSHGLAENSGSELKLLPVGSVVGRNDYGAYAFGGACPPKGDKAHRYVFTVYALNTAELKLPKEASAALIGYYLNSHTIEKATLVSYYGR